MQLEEARQKAADTREASPAAAAAALQHTKASNEHELAMKRGGRQAANDAASNAHKAKELEVEAQRAAQQQKIFDMMQALLTAQNKG